MTATELFPVIVANSDPSSDDGMGVLEVKITDEGIIVDLWRDGECIATFGATAQELADDYCHV